MSERTDKIKITPLTEDGAFERLEGAEAADTSKNISTQQGDGVLSAPKRKSTTSSGWKLSRMIRNEQEIITKKIAWQSLLGDKGKATFTEIAAGTNMTYAAWVRVSDWPGTQTSGMAILGKNISHYNGSAIGIYDLGSINSNCFIQCGSASWAVAKSALANFALIVITKSNTTLTAYLNNVSLGTSPNGATVPAITTLGWGAQGQDFNFFLGAVEEIAVFNRVLNSSEISALWNGGAGVYGDIANSPFDSGLLTLWHLDGDFEDASGNNNDMTGAGTYTWEIGKVEAPEDMTLEYQVWIPAYVPDDTGVDCTAYTNQNDCQADDCIWGTNQCCQYTDQSSCQAVSGCSWSAQDCNTAFGETQAPCQAVTGCSWSEFVCLVWSEGECPNHSGCSWSSGNSCTSFGYNDCQTWSSYGCSWNTGSCSGLGENDCRYNYSGCSWNSYDCISKTDQWSCGSAGGCSWSGTCSSFSTQSDCETSHPPCVWYGNQACSVFIYSGDCTGHSPCSWDGTSCSGYDNMTCNNYSSQGCSWVYVGDCSAYTGDAGTDCNNHSINGCSWWYGGDCSQFYSQGDCESHYLYSGGTCTWDGSYCSGGSWYQCSGSYYECQGTWYVCNGTYSYCDGTYCMGTYYQCDGDYAFCSGTYSYCSGSYYHCAGGFNTRCSGTYGACS